MKKLSGISRIDSGATHGWFVRAYRKGTTHSKFFSDRKFGGKNKALALAVAARDELRARLGPPSTGKHRLLRSNRNNKTGAVGVCRVTRTLPNGAKRHYFLASWRPEPNVAKAKPFSIDRLGERGAFEAAVRFRKEREREILKGTKSAQ